MKINEISKRMIEFRRELHSNPELSREEYLTQKRIIELLSFYKIEFDVTATTGVVGYINKGHKGRTVALRADIDALPIHEKNDCSYKSKTPGVMHACGHDAHTAILMGTAIFLKSMESEINGSIKLIFQPDEEATSGASRVVEEGFLDDVDYVLGLHVQPYMDVGEIEIKKGAFNAETGNVLIDVYGKSSHAAYPEKGVDSIVVAATLITQLQSIFTRSLSPLTQAVLTFGTIEGGVKTNIVAEKVTIEGTLRTLDKETRTFIKKRIEEICEGVGVAYNAKIIPTFYNGEPPLINDDDLIDMIEENAKKLTSVHKINIKKHPSMGGEDFGYYQEKAVGAFYHLGCGNKKRGITSSLHTDTFDIDEDCIEVGIEMQVMNVLSLINGGEE